MAPLFPHQNCCLTNKIDEEICILRQDMDQVKKDLAKIKTLLQGAIKRPAPQKTTGTVGFTGRPMLGPSDAPVTIVEFSDYQCPFCRRYSLHVFPTLKRDYIDTGKVRYVFRDFPLTNIHAQAEKAHEAAHCAGEVQQYWDMHDLLFSKQQNLSVPSLKKYATTLGLDSDAFAAAWTVGSIRLTFGKIRPMGHTGYSLILYRKEWIWGFHHRYDHPWRSTTCEISIYPRSTPQNSCLEG
jgi:hypothetical protein